MSIGLCADADAIPDLPVLAAGLEQSLRAHHRSDELRATWHA